MLSNEEINSLAVRFQQLKHQSENTKDYKEFNRFQNYCMKVLEPLVNSKIYKYKKFSNYLDLKQDGFEALLHSFDNYDHTKGNFSYWALQYIQTKVSRSANAHSTIKIPMKKTN